MRFGVGEQLADGGGLRLVCCGSTNTSHRCFAPIVFGSVVSTSVQQQLHHRRVAKRTGNMQRRLLPDAGWRRLCARLHQCGGTADCPVLTTQMQGLRVPRVTGVVVTAVRKQPCQHVHAVFDASKVHCSQSIRVQRSQRRTSSVQRLHTRQLALHARLQQRSTPLTASSLETSPGADQQLYNVHMPTTCSHVQRSRAFAVCGIDVRSGRKKQPR